jgi:hypothetical protein
MITRHFASLSTREKWLAGVVAAAAFLAATFFLLDGYSRQRALLRTQLESRTKQLRLARTMTADLAFWQQRDEWLHAHQPVLTDSDSAGVELLDRIKDLAKKHSVLLEHPSLRPADRLPNYTSVAVELETKSAWPALIDFMHELQDPEQFVALESANLNLDAMDPTQMRGRFKIARWFAPQ